MMMDPSLSQPFDSNMAPWFDLPRPSSYSPPAMDIGVVESTRSMLAKLKDVPTSVWVGGSIVAVSLAALGLSFFRSMSQLFNHSHFKYFFVSFRILFLLYP